MSQAASAINLVLSDTDDEDTQEDEFSDSVELLVTPIVDSPFRRSSISKKTSVVVGGSNSSSYDLLKPDSLVGLNVQVTWRGNNRFKGTIDQYRSADGKHHITYRDGDKRWYKLRSGTP